MKKWMASALLVGFPLIQAQAAEDANIAVGVNYGLLSGPTFEMTYAVSPKFQMRGSFSSGMGLSGHQKEDNIDYKVEQDGGINRIAFDYHPFAGNFFISAGYAQNNVKFDMNAYSDGETITLGNETYTSKNANLFGQADWDNGATVTLGWGHSPTSGWGGIVELGAIFTGATNVNLSGTGEIVKNGTTYDLATDPVALQALSEEEQKIQDDVSSVDVFPIVQVGINYRF
ncbi:MULTISPECIES: hypothetical protein [Thiomicrorhabdus]|uniref:Uncharacterized protein n=1 Tax=Thiomicrorhabdus heinhorstiae TaxID=2748010 RepID=A0ABS0BYN7_9GAMM|nr:MULTISPECIES: hypothetical protein [Thiomicrorhabdus]MBF6058917.1 hypothetical protein [Thiomicrorhabdus heinhorstiae]